MIVGIGTDIVEVERVLKANKTEKFATRYFTEAEQKIFIKKENSMAGNFATKEAVAKMFGTGFRDFSLLDIEVLRDELGKPYINLYNKAQEKAQELGIDTIHVSIADTSDYAVAYVIGEKRDA